jgi:prepilin-type N-terminal cleavage/methylation domain-containing protein
VKRSNRSGFTLLEVLVVLAILLTGFTALTQIQTSATREAVEAEEKTSVQVLCQNELDKILAGITEITPYQVLSVPDFDDWTITISLSEAPISGLLSVRIVARKSELLHVPSGRSGTFNIVQRPIAEVAVAQWVDPDRIRIVGRTASPSRDELPAQTRARRAQEGGVIGSLTAPPTADPFADFDQDRGIGSLTTPVDPFAASGFETPSDRIGGLNSP